MAVAKNQIVQTIKEQFPKGTVLKSTKEEGKTYTVGTRGKPAAWLIRGEYTVVESQTKA